MLQKSKVKSDSIQDSVNWDDLRIFLTVARRNNLDAAAAYLRLDPTTLGRRIRRLEAAIGARLFERSRKGHVPTPTGEWLLNQVEVIEQVVSRVGETISGEVQGITGTVRLSVTEAFGNVVIAPALVNLLAEFPALKLELIATSGFLSVNKREADMAVMLSRPTRGRLKVSKLTDYTLKLYANPEYLKNHAAVNNIADLHQQTLIGYVDDLIYSPRLRYYDEVDAGLIPGLTSSSLLAQKQLACTGCGIAMLPRFVAEQEPDLQLVLADEVTVTRSFWLAVHEDIAEHARIRAVINFLTELVATRKLQ
ncbi:MAG: DNA-binding transcriptional LysR family regulator [Candidatus Azotimanducaceae bacterium]|jgi:DNA-binding transcriptional LysR family regulator